jgi:hypothetical protein
MGVSKAEGILYLSLEADLSWEERAMHYGN